MAVLDRTGKGIRREGGRSLFALTSENVSVFHAHAFNIALLLAVAPPTAQEAQTKPGAQWEASDVTSDVGKEDSRHG